MGRRAARLAARRRRFVPGVGPRRPRRRRGDGVDRPGHPPPAGAPPVRRGRAPPGPPRPQEMSVAQASVGPACPGGRRRRPPAASPRVRELSVVPDSPQRRAVAAPRRRRRSSRPSGAAALRTPATCRRDRSSPGAPRPPPAGGRRRAPERRCRDGFASRCGRSPPCSRRTATPVCRRPSPPLARPHVELGAQQSPSRDGWTAPRARAETAHPADAAERPRAVPSSPPGWSAQRLSRRRRSPAVRRSGARVASQRHRRPGRTPPVDAPWVAPCRGAR